MADVEQRDAILAECEAVAKATRHEEPDHALAAARVLLAQIERWKLVADERRRASSPLQRAPGHRPRVLYGGPPADDETV